MRDFLSRQQPVCQSGKRQFYQQKIMFSAERTPLDAQTLREVAQKMRGWRFALRNRAEPKKNPRRGRGAT
jgi:hypothetical protein